MKRKAADNSGLPKLPGKLQVRAWLHIFDFGCKLIGKCTKTGNFGKPRTVMHNN